MPATRPIPEKRFRECNEDTATRMSFDAAGLDALNAHYRQVHGLPTFADSVLCLDPHVRDTRLFLDNPEHIGWADDGSVMILPNSKAANFEELCDSKPKAIKNSIDGLELVAWYVHPHQLEQSVFADPECRLNYAKAFSEFSQKPQFRAEGMPRPREAQDSIADVEKKTGVPYLATTLDLTPEHLPFLRNLKKTTLKHIKEVYGVTADDKVDMFFHNLTAVGTLTLHMHIRVNQHIHPHERARAFTLDEIIENLEKGITPRQMLLEKGELYFGRVGVNKRASFRELPELKFEEVPNPFRLEHNPRQPIEPYPQLQLT